jgi:DNA polymerase (family 10)
MRRPHHATRFSREQAGSVLERFMGSDLDMWPCGSYRRGLPTVGDLDIVVVGNPDAAELYHRTGAVEIIEKKRIHLFYNVEGRRFEVELARTSEDRLGAALLRWTGSAGWNRNLRELAISKGWRLTEDGLFDHGTLIHAETEQGILEALGVEWVEPAGRDL